MSVRNYKNIYKADINLKPLNVIVGSNGSGKSNFLTIPSFLNFIIYGTSEEVKYLLQTGTNRKFKGFFPQLFLSQDERWEIEKNPLTIELDFSNKENNFNYFYSISIVKKYIDEDRKRSEFLIVDEQLHFKLKHNKGKSICLFSQEEGSLTLNSALNSIFSIKKIDNSYTSGIKFIELILKTNDELKQKFGHVLDSFNKVLKTETVYLSGNAMRFQKDSSPQPIPIDSRLVKYNFEDEIIDLQNTPQWEILIKTVEEVLGLKNVFLMSFEKKNDSEKKNIVITYDRTHRFSFVDELSDGEIILLGLIVKIITNKSDIIFIEEIENSVHPNALSSLISLMNSYCDSKQFILTTHSSTLLNLVKPEQVFVASMNSYDMAEITMIPSLRQLKKKLKEGFISFGDLMYQDQKDEFEDIF